VTLFAISEDPVEESLTFARRYDINYPLLADTSGTVANQYTGTSSDQAALPGVVIIGRDGRVIFRNVGESKADRMTAAQILAAVDASAGTSGAGIVSRSPLDSWQLRLSAGGGVVRGDGDNRATGVGQLDLFVPLGRYVLVGPSLVGEPRVAPLDVNATVLGRIPFWNDIAALELGASGGWSPLSDRAWNVGARGSLWFAVTPSFSLQLGASVTAHDDDLTVALLLGIGVLR
jgi:hypothetical protein